MVEENVPQVASDVNNNSDGDFDTLVAEACSREWYEWCPSCKEEKTVEQFYSNKGNNNGLSTYCIDCTKAKRNGIPVNAGRLAKIKAYAAANPEKAREYKRRYREKNREKLRQDGLKYIRRIDIREGRKDYKKRYNEENQEAIRQYRVEYNARPNVRKRLLARKRLWAAFQRGADYHGEGEHITYAQWKITVDAFEDQCCYCGETSEVVEHLTPLSRGGKTEIANLAPACSSCNMTKGTKTAEEFSPTLAPSIRWIVVNAERVAKRITELKPDVESDQ